MEPGRSGDLSPEKMQALLKEISCADVILFPPAKSSERILVLREGIANSNNNAVAKPNPIERNKNCSIASQPP